MIQSIRSLDNIRISGSLTGVPIDGVVQVFKEWGHCTFHLLIHVGNVMIVSKASQDELRQG